MSNPSKHEIALRSYLAGSFGADTQAHDYLKTRGEKSRTMAQALVDTRVLAYALLTEIEEQRTTLERHYKQHPALRDELAHLRGIH